MREISEELGGISVTKIYKWNWDRHKRVIKGLPLTRDEEMALRYARETAQISFGCQTDPQLNAQTQTQEQEVKEDKGN